MAAKKNYRVDKNATWSQSVRWLDGNKNPHTLTGWSARLQGREKPGSPVLLDLSTEDGSITIDTVTARISWVASAAETNLKVDQLLYDLKLEAPSPSTTVKRLLEGRLIFMPFITE